MDCEQVMELLDAYALGAADAHEAAAIEEHVADCVRCWSSLDAAQRVAASLALSTAQQKAPPSLLSRVLAETERRQRPEAAARALAGGHGRTGGRGRRGARLRPRPPG